MKRQDMQAWGTLRVLKLRTSVGISRGGRGTGGSEVGRELLRPCESRHRAGADGEERRRWEGALLELSTRGGRQSKASGLPQTPVLVAVAECATAATRIASDLWTRSGCSRVGPIAW
jgi:hypothetical protein